MAPAIAHRIATWHPRVLTTALLLAFLAQAVGSDLSLTTGMRGVLLALPIGAMCAWLWALFHLARRASPDPKSPHWEWVFVIPPAVALAAGLADWSTRNSPAAVTIFLGLFVSLSLAAKTLEKVDAAAGNPSVGRMLGTALLMHFAALGVWVLRPRILRMASRSGRLPPDA